MSAYYPAVFHEEDGYWVEFPDLPGCQSEGKTLNEAIANAGEALDLYLRSLKERGASVPDASDIKRIKEPEDGFATLICADPD